jgi:hypothetical protein
MLSLVTKTQSESLAEGEGMFVFLESRKEIAKAHGRLEATLRREFPQRATKDIGYPGGRVRDARVYTDGHYWFWSQDHSGRQISNPRRLNWFGLFSERPGFGITVEINTAYEGRNDQTAGFFARDTNSGIIYLLHSGRVGGGTKGVGMNAFRAWSGEPLIEVADSSGGRRHALLVMPVEGIAASRSAIRYVDLVTRFKRAVRAGEIGTPAFQRKQKQFEDFYAEGRGRRTGHRSSEIDYVSRHGEVVDSLRVWRESNTVPKGARFVKNVLIDMGVAVGRKLVEVFEVKTSTARSDIYSALGQLMVHGTADNCRRVMVLPLDETLSGDFVEALARLRIELLRFRLNKKGVTIVGAMKRLTTG